MRFKSPGGELSGDPHHFRTVVLRLLGHNDGDQSLRVSPVMPEHGREPVDHTVGAANKLRRAAVGMLGIEFRHAGRQADATGNRIQFSDDHAVLCGDDVRPNNGGQIITKPLHTAIGDQRFRLSLIQPRGYPCGLCPPDALHIQVVQGAVKAQQLAPQSLKKRELVA